MCVLNCLSYWNFQGGGGGGDNIHVFTIKRRLNKLECRGKVNLVQ